MSAVVQLPLPPQDIRYTPARSLVGWMSETDALKQLLMGQPNLNATPVVHANLQRAHAAVRNRPPRVEASSAVLETPSEVQKYFKQLESDPGIAQQIAAGWALRLVNLREVRAFQPHVVLSVVDAVPTGITEDKVEDLAAITVLNRTGKPFNWNWNEQTRSWVVSSRSLNFHVLGQQLQQVPGLPSNFGFAVAEVTSFVRVIQAGTMSVLTDGYHRVVGLMRRGCYSVPALVRVQGSGEPIQMPGGMLPPDIIFGERPPLLPDYLDDSVSAEVLVEQTYRTIVIHAEELNQPIFN